MQIHTKAKREIISLDKLARQIKSHGYRSHQPQITYKNHRTVILSLAFTK